MSFNVNLYFHFFTFHFANSFQANFNIQISYSNFIQNSNFDIATHHQKVVEQRLNAYTFNYDDANRKKQWIKSINCHSKKTVFSIMCSTSTTISLRFEV